MKGLDWNALVDDLGPALFRYFRVSASEPDARDLVQETLLRLVRKFRAGEYRTELGSPRMYAFGLAHFVRLEFYKNRSPESMDIQCVSVADDSASRTGAARERETVRACILSLPSPQRDIFMLLVDQDLTLGEIGQVLSLPLNTVKSHVHRGKQILKEKLTQEGYSQ